MKSCSEATPVPELRDAKVTSTRRAGVSTTRERVRHTCGRGRGRPRHSYNLVLVAAAEVVDEHLLDRLVVSLQDVADGMAAHEVADLFR
jgi:hypothetical protein